MYRYNDIQFKIGYSQRPKRRIFYLYQLYLIQKTAAKIMSL